ncbi:MAG: heavy metal translocating P-type ATPase [Actinomycetes bacterium]
MKLSTRQVNRSLFVISLISLSFGFLVPFLGYLNLQSFIWAIGGLAGLIPATKWVIDEFKNKNMGSDILAVLALLGTLLTNEMMAAAIISLMLATGRVLESWAEGQAERQLHSLLERMPRVAHILLEDGSLKTINADDVKVGDILVVRSGEIVPVDGMLITDATLDESALTGESLPVNRQTNDMVLSGVLNAGNNFQYKALQTLDLSTYSGIIRLVESAQAKSAPGVRIANTWALRFVPIALTIAGLAWLITGEISRAIAVLVAATPCPLILAVPIAVVAGMSNAAKNGAVIKGGAALEQLARAEVVLLDKTGTLTYGGPEVGEIQAKPGFEELKVLQLAASLDQYSPHVIAKAIVNAAKERNLTLLSVSDVKENHGQGITGVVDGIDTKVGQITGEIPEWCNIFTPLRVGIYQQNELIGVLGLDDPIRSESEQMIKDLRSSGIKKILMVTGDRLETAQNVGAMLDLDEIHASLKPEDKMNIVLSEMKLAKGTVVAVGDGINDAPVLAASDVGVAMGARGATAASEAADVVIVDDTIDRLTRAISISKFSRNKALQAAGVGMGLSFVAMLLGAFGIFNASQGAIAQEFIDVIAILWALTALRNVEV